MAYEFAVGDRVTYREAYVVGTITSLCTDDDESNMVDRLDPENPCYTIQWDEGEDLGDDPFNGFERQEQLIRLE